ncbi:MAG TPA: peptidase domain-containing ABC transporter [Kofleriaceae bacterium]|nr:peptidase domain-containing ABC transporter [Kofleriaceae bacterium]
MIAMIVAPLIAGARALAGAGSRRRAIPHVPQMLWTDSGAACLSMVLAHHGKKVPLHELRQEIGVPREGVTPHAILEAGARHGLTGRGIQVELEEMALLPRAAILVWELRHFVVFDGLAADGSIRIIDPAHGPRVVPPSEVRRGFTGVALVLSPGEGQHPERARPRRTGMGRLLAELRGEGVVFGRILVASLLLRLFALAVPLLTALVVDKVVPRADQHLLLVAAIGVGFLVSFDALASILRAHLLLHMRTRVDTRVTLGFLDHLISLPYSFFQNRSTGDLIQRVGSSATAREILTSSTLSGLLDGCFVPLYAVVIFLLSPSLGLLVLVLACLHAAVFLMTRRRYRQLMVQDLEAQSRAQVHLVQMLAGIETLKVSGAESQSLARWLNLHSAQLNVSLERSSLSAGVDTVRRALETLAPIGILIIGAMAVTGGQLSLGSLLAVSALAGGLFGPLSALVASALQLQMVASYLDRIDDVLETPREQDQPGEPAHQLEGAISARGLCFRHAEDAALAVDDVSLDVPQGGSIAIVGPSGSGKSTLANLLIGLHRPTSGEVYFDCRPLSQLDARTVRRQIGVVPQTPFLFGGTVRENIALCAPDADLGRIMWAAQVACVHESIQALPMGYDTVISEGGASLSGGQRQRIAIARAVLRCPAVLMLDEATSALDAVTENRIMNHLGRLGATRILVAHRLSTVVDADLIVVLDQGRIVEYGRHRDLVARHGLYAALVGGQRARGERPPLEIAS